ncbi:hypothetical protein BHM03_00005837 [Ensete ventricosum]|uniref:Uncharacterized protein n=1 Tax=Ensete ventricosum TaxID=4639 RepID=A0A427AXK2_ENSVE|nr:hypothetical protein B296_00002093 [Ensete ventricosum]RZR79959.1 hypothetical protein BHM03_00005837 [Ensete ventricosum]
MNLRPLPNDISETVIRTKLLEAATLKHKLVTVPDYLSGGRWRVLVAIRGVTFKDDVPFPVVLQAQVIGPEEVQPTLDVSISSVLPKDPSRSLYTSARNASKRCDLFGALQLQREK